MKRAGLVTVVVLVLAAAGLVPGCIRLTNPVTETINPYTQWDLFNAVDITELVDAIAFEISRTGQAPTPEE
ncbi:MAG: hypothetical protein GXY33_20020 [Phycisphaerae bacterium]|nr:hypothetical protein [Phycisphaerae bacterium]